MSRANLPVALFFTGAAIFCAAGWTSESLAGWAAKVGPRGESGSATSGTSVAALLGQGRTQAQNAPHSSMTSNGVASSSSTAPMLAAPMGFDRSMKRVRELDQSDPWSGEHHLQNSSSSLKRMELENADPWSPSIQQAPRLARARLLLDESDPWTGILPSGR